MKCNCPLLKPDTPGLLPTDIEEIKNLPLNGWLSCKSSGREGGGDVKYPGYFIVMRWVSAG
jgi:hypothetical protein